MDEAHRRHPEADRGERPEEAPDQVVPALDRVRQDQEHGARLDLLQDQVDGQEDHRDQRDELVGGQAQVQHHARALVLRQRRGDQTARQQDQAEQRGAEPDLVADVLAERVVEDGLDRFHVQSSRISPTPSVRVTAAANAFSSASGLPRHSA
ncbi:MAG: hypothetical protein ACHQ2Z_16495 [Elusimicrobiota bacterium]